MHLGDVESLALERRSLEQFDDRPDRVRTPDVVIEPELVDSAGVEASDQRDALAAGPRCPEGRRPGDGCAGASTGPLPGRPRRARRGRSRGARPTSARRARRHPSRTATRSSTTPGAATTACLRLALESASDRWNCVFSGGRSERSDPSRAPPPVSMSVSSSFSKPCTSGSCRGLTRIRPDRVSTGQDCVLSSWLLCIT